MELVCNILIGVAFLIGFLALWKGDDHEPY